MPERVVSHGRSFKAMRVVLVELSLAFVLLASIAGTTALLLVAGGYPVGRGLAALWSGSVGSWYAFTSATLVRAVPLMLTGGAVTLAFRAGVFNIGAEGQLLVGAAMATTVALALPGASASWPMIPVALGAAAAGGALWAGVAAGLLEVISTIMLNFVALHLVSFLVRGPLQEPTRIYPQSSTVTEALQLPRIAGAGRLHVGIVFAVMIVVATGWMLRHTAVGFRLIAAGENPAAAASAGGIDVSATTTHAFMLSGALAGIAGGTEVLGVTFALYENISPGYGYTAIAVALLAKLDPWRVLFTAILFAALEANHRGIDARRR